MMWASEVLPRPGGPGEQHVVERLAAAPGGLDEDLELRGDLLLVDEVGEPLRAQRAVEVLLAAREAGVGQALRGAVRLAASPASGLLDPGVAGDAHVLAPLPSAARAAPRRSAPPALSPSAAVEQPLGLGERVAEVHQAVAGERARVAVLRRRWPAGIALGRARRRPSRAARRSAARRSACRRPGTAWKRFASPAAIARSSSRGAPPERIAIATLGPIPETEIRWRKRSRSSSLAKP